MANHKNIANQVANGGLMLNGIPPWLAIISEYNGELFEFMSRRFAKDARMMRELHERRSLSDLSELQASWVHETVQDYSAEATKLMGIALKQAGAAANESRAH